MNYIDAQEMRKRAQEQIRDYAQEFRDALEPYTHLTLYPPELTTRPRINFTGAEWLYDDNNNLRMPSTAEQQEDAQAEPQYPVPTGPVEYMTGVDNGRRYFVANNDADTSLRDQRAVALNPVNPTGRRNIANSPYYRLTDKK